MQAALFASSSAFLIGAALLPMATAGTLEMPPGIADEINVTSDSARGWIPTTDQRQAVIKTIQIFLDDIESGQYVDAYRLMSDGNKHSLTPEKFTESEQKFKTLAGPLKFWRILKVTWTKDPGQAPTPGVYAAVDLMGQFANVDRDCGYIVLYQSPLGGDFTVARRENSYLDNATAHQIEEKKSTAEVTAAWAQLSRSCPNYVVSPRSTVTAPGTQPLPEAPGSTIGFPTVAAALEALRARSDIQTSVQGGWTIVDDRANATLWSFSPQGYPAYPAAVKREIKQKNGAVYIEMNILCGATKAACDRLVLDFQRLNEAMKQHFRQQP
jgi:hypothetical protein